MANMEEKFVNSSFDEVDIVMQTDRRFDEAITAADAGEYDAVDAILKKQHESGELDLSEDTTPIEYDPEDDDAVTVEDCCAEDIREMSSEHDYDDEDGEMIDAIMDGDDDYED